jgi:hypothetical protein
MSKKKDSKDALRIVQVAQMLRVTYLRARDAMLSGKFGESWYDGRTLLVERAAVQKFLDSRKRTAD